MIANLKFFFMYFTFASLSSFESRKYFESSISKAYFNTFQII